MTTERLYYNDSYLYEFDAQTVSIVDGGRRVYLDRSAFYPASGGQLSDRGTLGGMPVLDVIDEGSQVAHLLAAAVGPGKLHGTIDWGRRFAFMQQHTAQHLLSAVLHEMFGYETVSVHLGEESATIELAVPAVKDEEIVSAEESANKAITSNRSVSVSFVDSSQTEGLRKESSRTGTLRLITIENLDKSACGGTHVRSTGEIGCVLIRKAEKIRGNTRLEFVSGLNAVRHARRDFDAMSAVGRALSCSATEAPSMVSALQEAAKEAGKQARRLAVEISGYRGRELYAATPESTDGLRRYRLVKEPLDDSARALAQAFVAGPKSVFLATGGGAVLMASSSDSGIHCGVRLKELLAEAGGRGGGGAGLAQGSVPDAAHMDRIAAALGF